MRKTSIICAFTLMVFTGIPNGYAENASNPLAAVNNTDLRAKFIDLDGPERIEFSVEGAYMLTPKLKFKYELHYWDTDILGNNENDWESLHLKPIYFTKQGSLGIWKYRLAVGADWILDFGNDDKGIGLGSDQIVPFLGVALMSGGGLVLVPLVQHFLEYSGPDVNTTSLRLIAIQSLPSEFWAKVDTKVPFDWENDTVPTTFEFQLGKTLSPSFATYVDGLVGIGGDKPYEWGIGVGGRFNY